MVNILLFPNFTVYEGLSNTLFLKKTYKYAILSDP